MKEANMKKVKSALREISCAFFVLLVILFFLFPEYFIFALFAVASEFGSYSHDVAWNI